MVALPPALARHLAEHIIRTQCNPPYTWNTAEDMDLEVSPEILAVDPMDLTPAQVTHLWRDVRFLLDHARVTVTVTFDCTP